ncbi:MAG: hypothetical protein ABFS02_03480 [Pseudomonadota bacterium]
MKSPVVIIGMGEMGSVLARGFLRSGHPVYPVTRHLDIAEEAGRIPEPVLALVAVTEDILHPVLETIPMAWRDRLGMIQNELLPRDWMRHGITDPTVVVVWFEKKKGMDTKVLLPSAVYGPHTPLIREGLASVDISSRVLTSKGELLFELVRKNVYILTVNIAGLVTGGSVSDLWSKHRKLAMEVANEVIDIQEWLCQETLPREQLIDGMVEGFDADPEHVCTGRVAHRRLERALAHAWEACISTPILQEIADQTRD